MTIKCDLYARFPELNTNAIDAVIDGVIDSWQSYTGLSYSTSTKEAVLNLIAHLAVIDSSASASPAGQLASVSVGSVSKSYAVISNASASSAFWMSTKYGQRYQMLMSYRIGPRFV